MKKVITEAQIREMVTRAVRTIIESYNNEDSQFINTDSFINFLTSRGGNINEYLYNALQTMNIDCSNIDEPRYFMMRVKRSNPDLYEKIGKTMYDLYMDNSLE